MEPKKFAKRNLEIIDIKPERGFGQDNKTLLPLMARDLSLPKDDPLYDKGLEFVIFISVLKEYMTSTPTKVIIADYEERPSNNPEYGPNRSIQQIYVNGEPVSRKKMGYGKSAEIVRLENELKARSIEATVAVKEIGMILRGDKDILGLGIDVENFAKISNKYWQAINTMLDNYLKAPQKPPARQPVPMSAPVSDGLIKNAGDLLTRASKLDPPKSPADVLTILSVGRMSEIPDLDVAWKVIQGVK